MKKLKIFLLLSILLCFGFALSSEVHAQGGGPKPLEVDDVLPATSQLKISWDSGLNSFLNLNLDDKYSINSVSNKALITAGYYAYLEKVRIVILSGEGLKYVYDDGWVSPYTDYSGGHNYTVIDTEGWDISKRTINSIPNGLNCFYWEDLNAPNAKPFEVGDTLPAGYIKISWDFTGKPMAVNGDFLISSDGDFTIRIWEFGNITLFINDEMFYADTPGNTIITLTESVTITDMDGYDDYYEYIHGALFWEVVSEDYINGFMEARGIYGFNMGGYWISGEQAWNNGYDLGSELAWEEGFEYGMEIYGYFDPITNQWLSVEEYLELYGTDKPGQSDFYGNFDKYFIPAMIIVFGGVIVLTILKVFKGRE